MVGICIILYHAFGVLIVLSGIDVAFDWIDLANYSPSPLAPAFHFDLDIAQNLCRVVLRWIY